MQVRQVRQVRRALLLGRFQPFHLGHLLLARKILETQDELIIGIGSAQESRTAENPFTAGERMLMIVRSLAAAGISRQKYYVVPIEDIGNHLLWADHVRTLVPPFQTAYCEKPQMREAFAAANCKVLAPQFFEREKYCGTSIRQKMLAGKGWKELVPPQVAEVVAEVGGAGVLNGLS